MTATDQILGRVRAAGGRITVARRMVVSALVESGAHMTAEEVATSVQREHPEVHLSTIYRTLESLEELGLVQHTHLGHGPAVFHVEVDVHQHLVCDECGVVVDVPVALLDDLNARLQAEYAFRLHAGHFALVGRCLHHDGPAA